jgi:general secretion pathway protein D
VKSVVRSYWKMFYPIFCAVIVSGCISNASSALKDQDNGQLPAMINPSYLESESAATGANESSIAEPASAEQAKIERASSSRLKPIQWPISGIDAQIVLEARFSDKDKVTVSAERMPLVDFLHYVFGELLGVNYVFDQLIADSTTDINKEVVTLNIADQMSSRELFKLASNLLADRGLQIKYGGNVFYIHTDDDPSASQKNVIGVGGNVGDVPNTTRPILQIVPLKYGAKISVERSLRTFGKAKIVTEYDQGAVFISGNRGDVIQAVELIKLVDTPAARSKFVSLIELTFVSPSEFSDQVALLLDNEGVSTAIGKPSQRGLTLVPLQQLGGIAVFASNETLLQRVEYWSTILDVPGKGSQEQYFLFHPQFARAKDLGESVSALLGTGGSFSNGNRKQMSDQQQATGNAPSAARSSGLATEKIKMVVDERANALVFYTSGSEYQALLPLLTKLDTLPKQVSMDIVIAEVTLKDEFKFGVEWALSRSEVNLTTQGAFGATTVGGLGLIINGAEGPLTGSFLSSNSLVKVLSSPTIIARDGVAANINVGSEISVVGQTTQDPINGDRQTTSSEYRKTGIDVTVTPTVNAEGIVVMEVSMSISNSVPSSSGASGNPDIFSREISTEVVAESGNTVLLGGLISESFSTGGDGVPGLSRIPLLGSLFKADSDSTDRTELIMLVTPKVLDNAQRWNSVKEDFKQSLQFMDFAD